MGTKSQESSDHLWMPLELKTTKLNLLRRLFKPSAQMTRDEVSSQPSQTSNPTYPTAIRMSREYQRHHKASRPKSKLVVSFPHIDFSHYYVHQRFVSSTKKANWLGVTLVITLDHSHTQDRITHLQSSF